jgi:membrane fusion protein, multidrug efflux system
MGSRLAGRKERSTMKAQSEETKKEPRESIPPLTDQGNGGSMDSAPEVPPAGRSYRRTVKLALISVAVLAALAVGIHYYLYARAHESTDDAFIDSHTTAISPKVASYVSRVYIDDNWHVKQGDLLVELDARDFEARLAQAQANLAAATARHQSAEINVRVVSTTAGAGIDQAEAGVQAAQRQVDEGHSRLEQARAQVDAAAAEATRAKADGERYERLLTYRAVSRQERDNAVATDTAAAANLDAARQAQQAAFDNLHRAESQLGEAKARLASARVAPSQVAYSRSQVDTSAAEIAQAEAEVRQAKLNLSYTKIYAPESGRVTRKSVEPGRYVQVGQTLFSIVPDRVWVVANFKETQLRYMRPGQPATIKVDAYPDKVFKGHVDSIQAGSGAAFSLLPPENATGNYVKVVQRVPVKILIDDPPGPNRVLGPGMSVEPEVTVR